MQIVQRRIRLILVTFLFVLSFASLTSTQRVEAQQTRSGSEFDYYSDDTYTEMVGFWIFCNNGQQFRSGQTTPYRIIVDAGC